jgi:hypothetical protein
VPRLRLVVVKLAALPAVTFVPITLPPSQKLTGSPFGTLGLTVAVNVTDWP